MDQQLMRRMRVFYSHLMVILMGDELTVILPSIAGVCSDPWQ